MRVRHKKELYSVLIFAGILLLLTGIILESLNTILFSALIFAIGIYFCYYSKSKRLLCDPMYLYPGMCFLYSFAYPFFSYVGNYVGFLKNDYSYNQVLSATIFNSVFFVTFSLLIALFYKNNINTEKFREIYKFNRSNINLLFEFCMGIYVIALLRIYLSFGLSSNLSSSLRFELNKSYAKIPFNAYLGYMFIGSSIFITLSFFSTTSLRRKMGHVPALIIILIYYCIQISSGNRREFIYFIISLSFYYFFVHNGRISKKMLSSMLAFVIIMGIIGVQRTFENSSVVSSDFMIYTIFGEFINPEYTLLYYMSHPGNPKYGSTYLGVFFNLIPRSILPNKPYSLGEQFILDANTGFGYGFTPQCESYINFGAVGAVVGAIFLFIVLKLICKNNKKSPYLYVAAYAELMNVFRSDFSSLFTEIIIISFTLKFLSILNNELGVKQ